MLQEFRETHVRYGTGLFAHASRSAAPLRALSEQTCGKAGGEQDGWSGWLVAVTPTLAGKQPLV